MILDRFYTPADDELIYHYCPAMAFLEIIKSRTVWSSAYYVLNDSTEREWGYSIFARVADQLRGELATSTPKISATTTRVQIAIHMDLSFAVARFERA